MNIIALDIDDCILPSNVNYFGRTDDNLQVLEINLKRLVMILDKYDMKVFVTSSWYILLGVVDEKLVLKTERNNVEIVICFGLIKKYLEKYIIGLSCGDREVDINNLKKENKVVVLDDWDLEHLENDNCKYIQMKGFIDGNVGFKIHNFMV